MLSLPDEWDYTLKGLSMICKEGIDAIRVSIVELENHGYIERRRNRNEKGQLTNTEYIIREFPIAVPLKCENPILEEPTLENPILDNPTQEKPILENSTQINKDKTIKKELNKDCIKYPSINHETSIGSIDRYEQSVKRIKKNIEYDSLIYNYDKSVIDEIVNVMAEVMTVNVPYYTIEKKQYPAELVKHRLDLCQYFGQKKLKYYADFFSSSSSLCCGVI